MRALTGKLLKTLKIAVAVMQSSGEQDDLQTLDDIEFERFFRDSRGGDKPELPDNYQQFNFINGIYSCLRCRAPAQFEKVEARPINRLIRRPQIIACQCRHN